jgi:hypothetical protein
MVLEFLKYLEIFCLDPGAVVEHRRHDREVVGSIHGRVTTENLSTGKASGWRFVAASELPEKGFCKDRDNNNPKRT